MEENFIPQCDPLVLYMFSKVEKRLDKWENIIVIWSEKVGKGAA